MEKDGFARVMILGGQMVEEIVEQQRSDSLAPEGTRDAQAEDVGDRRRERVRGRQDVLILLVAPHASLDLRHDETHDFTLGARDWGGSGYL